MWTRSYSISMCIFDVRLDDKHVSFEHAARKAAFDMFSEMGSLCFLIPEVFVARLAEVLRRRAS